MFGDVIVPLDGSPLAALALEPAAVVAKELDSFVRVVSYLPHGAASSSASAVRSQVDQLRSGWSLEVDLTFEERSGSVGADIAAHVAQRPNALVCMATHGRGRSAALLGSVASDVLRRVSTSVLLVGPEYQPSSFRVDRPLLVALDGSAHAEAILPIAESWAIVFHNDVELVSVLEPVQVHAGSAAGAPVETSYLHRVADGVEATLGRAVSFDVLHDDHVARGIVRHAAGSGAGLVALTTHGATGRDRLVTGSVAADVIRHSPCPVLALRPLP